MRTSRRYIRPRRCRPLRVRARTSGARLGARGAAPVARLDRLSDRQQPRCTRSSPIVTPTSRCSRSFLGAARRWCTHISAPMDSRPMRTTRTSRCNPVGLFYHTDPFGHAAFQPRYYYAIASAAPLNLSRLQTSLGATRRVLGRMYSSYRPYDVIDRLTEIIVPMQTDEDWATDLFVDWPAPAMPIFTAFHLVRCANGRVIQVPSSYPYYGCPGDAALAVAAVEPQAKPPKEVVKAPRAPRKGARDGVELSSPGVDSRRRAETSARRPRPEGMSRSPLEGIRYSGDRVSTSSPGPSPRAPASSSTGGAERSAPVERGEPASKPATSGESSGKERKP